MLAKCRRESVTLKAIAASKVVVIVVDATRASGAVRPANIKTFTLKHTERTCAIRNSLPGRSCTIVAVSGQVNRSPEISKECVMNLVVLLIVLLLLFGGGGLYLGGP